MVNVPFVDLRAQHAGLKDEIDRVLRAVVQESAFVRGPFVTAFETEFARCYGVRHCISVASGTDALYICLKMLGVGGGDEVLTPAGSWISSSETITQTGAQPVFIDAEPDFFTLDPEQVRRKITSRTRAILAVHLLGQPAAMHEICAIAREHGLLVVEDCAHAHLAELNGTRVGLFGIGGAFSFYPGKNLGAFGDAGAIITNDDDFAEKVRLYARHGAPASDKHCHLIEGINSRMDGLQAAVLSVKLPHLTKWNLLRQEHARRYNELLAEVPAVQPPKERTGASHVYHVYQIRCQNRNNLEAYLNRSGIATARHYPVPLPFVPAYHRLGHRPEEFPVVHQYQQEILSLPVYPEMSIQQLDFVADRIRSFYSA